MMRITETVKHLIIINVIFFIGSYLAPGIVDYLTLHSVQSDKFKVWQLFTHMFMHGGIPHIFFNMFALFSFGGLLEQIWGPKKFIFFYVSCGLGSAALHLGVNYFEIQHILDNVSHLNLSAETAHNLINVPYREGNALTTDQFTQGVLSILQNAGKIPQEGDLQPIFDAAVVNQTPMLGASGAIYGLLVAFAFMFPNAELMLMFIPIPIKAKYFVPVLLAYDLFSGVRGQSVFGGGSDGVAHFAHLGGAVLGFLMMWYWKKNQYNGNRWN